MYLTTTMHIMCRQTTNRVNYESCCLVNYQARLYGKLNAMFRDTTTVTEVTFRKRHFALHAPDLKAL